MHEPPGEVGISLALSNLAFLVFCNALACCDNLVHIVKELYQRGTLLGCEVQLALFFLWKDWSGRDWMQRRSRGLRRSSRTGRWTLTQVFDQEAKGWPGRVKNTEALPGR
jgi:hypothetical protein